MEPLEHIFYHRQVIAVLKLTYVTAVFVTNVACKLVDSNKLGENEHVEDDEFKAMEMQPPPLEKREQHDPPFEDCCVELHTPRLIDVRAARDEP